MPIADRSGGTIKSINMFTETEKMLVGELVEINQYTYDSAMISSCGCGSDDSCDCDGPDGSD